MREATFNALESMNAVKDALVLDLFAGTGACGIEALSRGASSATFVDRDAGALDVVRANLALTGLDGTVIRSDAMRFLAGAAHFDLAIVDPPYEFRAWLELLAVLDASLAVCESDRTLDTVEGWSVVRQRSYGTTVVTILKRET